MVSTTVMSIDYIVKSPRVCGGAARLAQTRLTVHAIIGQIKSGTTIEELLEGYAYLPLTRAQVHAALAYYYDHQAEIDALLGEEAQLLDQIKREAIDIRRDNEEFITAKEASERLGLSSQSSQIAHLCQEGKLVCKKVANRWFVSLASVEAYAAGSRKPGPRQSITNSTSKTA
jgi:uncharacterized protein (DUF433 family)